ncbi:hypothetical protein U5801_23975 [Lamprobacter modestohalophilus]|nr:hypothetical protein [Lamprobacter modestohalophilus]MEA1052844.1 hypothetical protein [Lamprobacter modestohalophilus]
MTSVAPDPRVPKAEWRRIEERVAPFGYRLLLPEQAAVVSPDVSV